jgi:aryl-alcohol dehydrogenase-like predicted oxidoreductase
VGAPRDECARILGAFQEAGGNFVDTADAYTNGTAERYVGELLGSGRDEWVLATKYTASRNPRDPNGSGNHRKSLVHGLDASLERLGTDYVDLLWVHIWDFFTPIEEVMRALDDQVRAGKVLYVGISDTPAWIIARANALAEQRGWTPFTAVQAQYSLIERTAERDLAPMARALDLALCAWSPLGSGVLTGKYQDGAASGGEGRLHDPSVAAAGLLNDRTLEIARVVGEVASEVGATSAQVALAWLRRQPGVVLPVLGARKHSQLIDNLGALEIELDRDQRARLDDASAIDLGLPHEFIADVRRTSFVLGDAHDRIDNHRAERSGLPAGRPQPEQLESESSR